MFAKEVYLTREGYEKLRKELNYIKNVRRRELSKEIGAAREHGDLRENAEYDAAKEAMALNEERIALLEDQLTDVRIIEEMNIPSDKVYLGAKVTLKNAETEGIINYMLVSGLEADIDHGKISIASPIGKGLLGHKEGDLVEIEVPAGIINYEVIKISR
jgi:transcription elongation factor GreA